MKPQTIQSRRLQTRADGKADYEITVPAAKGVQRLTFSVDSNGAVAFDNAQAGAQCCKNRRISRAVGAEMARLAGEQVPGALGGRSPRGLGLELWVHYWFYRLRILRVHTRVTDLGSLDPAHPGYDTNGFVFERPVRGLPKAVKALARRR